MRERHSWRITKPRQKELVLSLRQQKFQLIIVNIIMLAQLLKRGVMRFSSLKCQKCPFKSKTPSLECDSCGYLLNPQYSLEGVSYFDLYRIPVRYDIHKEAVMNTFKEFQKKYHPDKFSAKDEVLGEYSTSLSSTLTDGRQVLLDDIKRATYLLKLKGIRLAGDDNKVQPVNDPELIQEIFQLQSSVNESTNPSQLSQFQKNVQQKMVREKKEFGNNFSAQKYQQCRKNLEKIKYYDQIRVAIEGRRQQLSH